MDTLVDVDLHQVQELEMMDSPNKIHKNQN